MASDTASPISRRRSALPSGLEQRLLLSYLTVFIAVLALFAVAMHAAFAAVFERETTERLRAMAKIAESVADTTRSGFSVDLTDETIRALNPRTDGLRWSDASGRVVTTYGLQPRDAPIQRPQTEPVTASSTQGQPIRMMTLGAKIGDPKERDILIAAILAEAPFALRMRAVDLSILAALVLAVVGSLIAGRWLTRPLMQGLESNMKALQDFTADAAHELRGPLTAVATNAANAAPLDANKLVIERGAMESIASATAQMIRVSDDLLTLARANQSLERELFVVDLDAHVVKIVALYREEARRKGVMLDARIVERARVYGNPDQIERIVGNLVQNAIRYTPAGGSVTVVCAKDRWGSRVTVTDTGIGIAAEHLERIFDRFWRADAGRSEDGGSGLGLTIARELARRHGGDIAVTSRLGVGSLFAVTFPSRPPRNPRWS
jgi:OmpR-family two-component system manganese-sensing sensor histidine kinase